MPKYLPRYYFNQGDLCQMIDQKIFLKQRGFDIEDSAIYASIGNEVEYLIGIKAIYESRVNGWWNYKNILILNGICTSEEFRESLGISVERSRQ